MHEIKTFHQRRTGFIAGGWSRVVTGRSAMRTAGRLRVQRKNYDSLGERRNFVRGPETNFPRRLQARSKYKFRGERAGRWVSRTSRNESLAFWMFPGWLFNWGGTVNGERICNDVRRAFVWKQVSLR